MAESEPTTSNGTTLTDAIAYVGDDAPSGVRAQALLGDAERAVRDIAPPPDPVPDDYKIDARSAEMYMFAYYAASPGYISSASLDGVSVNFAKVSENGNPATERVKAIMSRWIRGTPPRATVSANRFRNVLSEDQKW